MCDQAVAYVSVWSAVPLVTIMWEVAVVHKEVGQ